MRNKVIRGLLYVLVIAVLLGLKLGHKYSWFGLIESYDDKVATAKLEMRVYESCVLEHTMRALLPSEDEGLEAIVKDHCVRKIEKDPWGNEFVYIVEDEAEGLFDICSYGKDGKEGGTGKNADICLSDKKDNKIIINY